MVVLRKSSDDTVIANRAALDALSAPVEEADPRVTFSQDIFIESHAPGATSPQRKLLFAAGVPVRVSQVDALYQAGAPVAGLSTFPDPQKN